MDSAERFCCHPCAEFVSAHQVSDLNEMHAAPAREWSFSGCKAGSAHRPRSSMTED